MSKKSKGLYTITKKRKFIIPGTIILFLSLAFIGIISLMPNRGYYLGNTNTLGVGRSALFPFVYYDSYRNLYVLTEDNTINTIDDSVYQSVHNYETGKVYYLRDSSLFEYDILQNSRKELCTDVIEFGIFDDNKAIACVSSDKNIYIFSISTGEYTRISENPVPFETKCGNMVLGESHILFLDNYNPEIATTSADLMVSNENGTVSKLASNVDYFEEIYISEDDDYVAFYHNEELSVVRINGKNLQTIEKGKLLGKTEQTEFISSKTKYISGHQCVSFGFVLQTTESGNDLLYFKRNKVVSVDENITNIEINASNGYCFYTKISETEGFEDLYMSVSGTKPRKIVTVPADSNYIFDELQGYIYFQTPDKVLSRIYVKDRLYKIVQVSSSSGALSIYKNRPYIVYKSEDDVDTFILLDKNVVERYEENEIRLYGSSTDVYLKYKKNGSGTNLVSGTTSLDLYVNGSYKRIANSVSNDCIFFDKNFENVFYVAGGKYYVWHDGVSTEITMPSGVKEINAVDVIE